MHAARGRWPDLEGWPLALVVALLFVAGVFNDPPWRNFDASQKLTFLSEPGHIAASLLRDGTFANPFGPGVREHPEEPPPVAETGPTAHLAPVWPFLLFVLIKVCGTGAGGWLALRSLTVLALSAQYALLPVFAPLFGFSRWVGMGAAMLGLLAKPAKEEMWEANLAGLATLLLTASACYWSASREVRVGKSVAEASLPDRKPKIAWGVGLLAGFVILLQPVVMLVYAAWVLMARLLPGERRRSVALWLAPCLVCAPWVIRNQLVLGAPLTIRDNLGIELYASFNDCAVYGFEQGFAQSCVPQYHPNTNPSEAAAVRELGEYRYNQDRLQRAVQWIWQHPHRSAKLILQRVWFFWFPAENGVQDYARQRTRTQAFHLMTIASFAGLALVWRRKLRCASWLLLWTLLFPAIYYLVEFSPRYRHPIYWVTWLGAAYALCAAVKVLNRSRPGPQTGRA